jgi:glycerol uptake facilitator protein
VARILVAEMLGTLTMVALGTGTVAAHVLLGWPSTLGGIALCWGGAVLLGIVVGRSLGSAHLNPAVTAALSWLRPASTPRALVPSMALAQLAGAIVAGALVLTVFGTRLEAFESEHGIRRGAPGSEVSARMFGEYFPDPGRKGAADVSPLSALAHEAVATAVLLLVIVLVTDPRRALSRRPWLGATTISLTVALLIAAIAPVTQAGLNPARDLGPRLVAYAAGFGEIALPGPKLGFWIYLVGPLLGALGGAAASRLVPLPPAPQPPETA